MNKIYHVMILIFVIFMLTIWPVSTSAAESSLRAIEDDISLVMTPSPRAADTDVMLRVSKALLEGDATRLLSKYEKSNDRIVRNEVVRKYDNVLSHTQNPVKRKELASHLAVLATDQDAYVYKQALKSLAKLDISDFTEDTRRSLMSYIDKQRPNSLHCLVLGVLLAKDQKNKLRSYLPQDNRELSGYEKYGLSWYARLALARIGSKTDAEECVRMIKNEPDVVLRTGQFLQAVAWTHTPQALSLVLEYLNSDECLPSTITFEGKGTPVAYKALDVIIQGVSGCPVKYNGFPGVTTPQDLSLVREWVKNKTTFTWSSPNNLTWP